MRGVGRIGECKPAEGNGLGAESEEKREPMSDIDTGVVDSVKARLARDGRLEKRTYLMIAGTAVECQKLP
jgi:hypothetical protein